MNYQSFVPITGTITNISSTSGDCCNSTISLRENNQITNFVVSSRTFVADSLRLRQGMRVAAYYDVSLPVPLIFPPRYQAEIIAPLRPEEFTSLSFFNRNLVDINNSLRLNIGPSTTITTQNGQAFRCPPTNQILLVYYTNTTRSLPAQTTPRKIIVFC